jgi:CheY-like chemotaxis protein
MEAQRYRQEHPALHVLVVEHEPAVLSRICGRLLAERCDVSTARGAAGLVERVARIMPDIVLMDVLLPELDSGELERLVDLCRGGTPGLVVHTKMLRPMLRRVLDVRKMFGFIPKTEDDAEFSRQFRDVAERLASELPTQIYVPRAQGPATSGTYAVDGSATPEVDRTQTLKYG